MKIAILTQPLHNNYGGLLQAYALQTTLKRMGHDVWIINRDFKKKYRGLEATKWFIKKILGRTQECLSKVIDFPNQEEQKIISTFTSEFVRKNIYPISKKISNPRQLRKLANDGFECFIVGSDQVWRLSYSPCLTNYYLDFVKNKENIKRISYAASFGLEEWHYPESLTVICKQLIKKFDAVSVREDSAVQLCNNFLNVEAQHLIDPTLLLRKEDYINLISTENEPKSPGDLFYYILDESEPKQKLIELCSDALKLTPFTVFPAKIFSRKNQIERCIFPPVTKWLKAFDDAKFVITDSFHGCVFSILFNIPFIVIANTERGLSRFTSFLRLYNLLDRLIINSEDCNHNFRNSVIDWSEVNNKLEKERSKSTYFLNYNLK